MTTTNQTIDPLEALQIMVALNTALAGSTLPVAIGICECICKGTPAVNIIREIKEMAADNGSAVEGMLGTALYSRIVNYAAHVPGH